MKITKLQLKQIIMEELEKVELEKKSDSDSRELEPEEAVDAAEHAIEIVDALKDLIASVMGKDEETDEE